MRAAGVSAWGPHFYRVRQIEAIEERPQSRQWTADATCPLHCMRIAAGCSSRPIRFSRTSVVVPEGVPFTEIG